MDRSHSRLLAVVLAAILLLAACSEDEMPPPPPTLQETAGPNQVNAPPTPIVSPSRTLPPAATVTVQPTSAPEDLATATPEPTPTAEPIFLISQEDFGQDINPFTHRDPADGTWLDLHGADAGNILHLAGAKSLPGFPGFELPLVVDADGLNALANPPEALPTASSARILTPHPGEFARLIGKRLDGEARIFLAGEYVIVDGWILKRSDLDLIR